MPLPVLLQDVAGELQLVSDASHVYLNKRTGETRIVTDDEVLLLERDEIEDDLPDWQMESLAKNREVMDSEHWLALPGQWEINDYRITQRFCDSVESGDDRDQLLGAISGRGAFRYFRDTVERLGLLESWYAYRDRAYEEIAASWLEENEIPFITQDGECA